MNGNVEGWRALCAKRVQSEHSDVVAQHLASLCRTAAEERIAVCAKRPSAAEATPRSTATAPVMVQPDPSISAVYRVLEAVFNQSTCRTNVPEVRFGSLSAQEKAIVKTILHDITSRAAEVSTENRQKWQSSLNECLNHPNVSSLNPLDLPLELFGPSVLSLSFDSNPSSAAPSPR